MIASYNRTKSQRLGSDDFSLSAATVGCLRQDAMMQAWFMEDRHNGSAF